MGWKIAGVVEYWNGGVKVSRPNTPMLHHSITPFLIARSTFSAVIGRS